MKQEVKFYLCNGRACEKKCNWSGDCRDCTYTSDRDYAANPEAADFEVYQTQNRILKFEKTPAPSVGSTQ
ncbi:hypothetical protein [Faecalibaculum rodentium]|uniref:hypothetical protein n=1 Tax=Faecalibaculum rodentium TaxID=1702221 RepID=UPI0027316084|nr:hypothetical protein [Faecalibaculum rodentium]